MLLAFYFWRSTGPFYNLLNDKIHHKEECTASLVVFKGNTQTNLTLNFMYSLDESKGTVAVSGSYLDGGNCRATSEETSFMIWSKIMNLIISTPEK